jgi:glutamate/tyrosine decarboxylase-like PLP-dependent enzyme
MPSHPVDWTSLLTTVAREAARYRADLPSRAVAPAVQARDVLASLENLSNLPESGLPAERVLEVLIERATPGLAASSGPRFFGWVTGGTLGAAVAADWLTSVWDQNAGTAAAPAAVAFETLALDWVRSLLDLPTGVRGALVTGAMAANFTALAAARTRVLGAVGWDVERDGLFGAPKIRVLCGHERHSTIDKALRLLGLGKAALTPLDTDSQGRLSAKALATALTSVDGPVIVCAQAGNVNSGAFDPLADIARALQAHLDASGNPERGWLHVDGAFGLWARASGTTRELAHGAELADSWATDGHKFLNVPYDSGIVLTRHPQALRRAMAVSGAYLPGTNDDDLPNPGALGPELSRRARGFALFAALLSLGRSGVSALVEQFVRQARTLAAGLGAVPGLHIENDVVFNQVVVRPEPPQGTDPHDFARQVVDAIQREGTCYPTSTVWRGVPALRFSVINADTSDEDIEKSVAAVARVMSLLR